MISDSYGYFRDLVAREARQGIADMPARPKLLVKDMAGRISINRSMQLWFDLDGHGEGNGFIFVVTEWTEGSGEFEDDYADPKAKAEILFHGIVYYDGLRHLFTGSKQTENEGYLYYQRPKELALVFEKLADLEQKFCNKDLLEDRIAVAEIKWP